MLGMNAAERSVKSHLADGNAHAAGALVAESENSLAVAEDDAFHAVVAGMAENLGDAIPIGIADEQAARLAPDFAEALAAFTDSRGIHQRQHLLYVANEEGVEKGLVGVLQVAKKGIFIEGSGLPGEGLRAASDLLIETADVRGKQAVQVKDVAFVIGEGGAFVEAGSVD